MVICFSFLIIYIFSIIINLIILFKYDKSIKTVKDLLLTSDTFMFVPIVNTFSAIFLGIPMLVKNMKVIQKILNFKLRD
jgi:hypothetical protein